MGYGDIPISYPNTTYPFLAIYIIFSTVLVAFAINNLNEARTRKKRLVQFSEMLMRKEDLKFLQDVETGSIGESEFVLAVLLHFEIISQEDVTPWKLVSILLFVSPTILPINLFQLL